MSRDRRAHTAAALGVAMVLTALAGCDLFRPPPAVLRMDPRQADLDARWALRGAAQDPNPFTRSQALEALAQTLGAEAGPMFLKALKDPNPTVRFAGAMAIGDVQYAPAKDVLLDLAKVAEGAESDKRVFCAILFALHRLGDDTHTPELGALLFDEEEEVRANAALVMGKMGIPAAVEPLRNLESDEQDRNRKVRLNALEAMARLGDQRSIGVLEGFTKWPDLDFQLVAIRALSEVPAARSLAALRPVLKSPVPRVRVAAAGALAKLGSVDEDSYEFCTAAARDPEAVLREAYGKHRPIMEVEVASLQELAARALGQMDQEVALDVLHPLLKSARGGVRVGAATSILRLLRHRREAERRRWPAAPDQADAAPAARF